MSSSLSPLPGEQTIHLELFQFAFSLVVNTGIEPEAKWWRRNGVIGFSHQLFSRKIRWLTLVHFSGVGHTVHCSQDLKLGSALWIFCTHRLPNNIGFPAWVKFTDTLCLLACSHFHKSLLMLSGYLFIFLNLVLKNLSLTVQREKG